MTLGVMEMCMALALHFEARGEPFRGRVAVAAVIMERVRSHRYPSNVCDVVFQPYQFSFVQDGKTPPIKDEDAWRGSQELAVSILSGVVDLPDTGATHFHTKFVSPSWAAGAKVTARIGNHIFYSGVK